VPLVLNLHGLGSNATQQMLISGMSQKASAEGFVIVAPNASGAGWSLSGDVAYIRDLLDAVESELCIDSARVYSTGLSMGAMMSSSLACNLSERIAAIAPVSGALFPGGCGDPVPVIAFHATADSIVSFSSAETAMAGWSSHNGCTSSVEEPVGAYVHRIYQGCDVATEFYIIEGGNHFWPGGSTTTNLLWDFFEGAEPAPAAPPGPPAEGSTPPQAPSGLAAVQDGPGTAALTWTDNATNETEFQLDRCSVWFWFFCSYSQIATLDADTTAYPDGGLSSGSYRYRLRACNAAGCSAYSNTASISVN
jgi:poly(3-hydroxybutyrate) depolymerase